MVPYPAGMGVAAFCIAAIVDALSALYPSAYLWWGVCVRVSVLGYTLLPAQLSLSSRSESFPRYARNTPSHQALGDSLYTRTPKASHTHAHQPVSTFETVQAVTGRPTKCRRRKMRVFHIHARTLTPLLASDPLYRSRCFVVV